MDEQRVKAILAESLRRITGHTLREGVVITVADIYAEADRLTTEKVSLPKGLAELREENKRMRARLKEISRATVPPLAYPGAEGLNLDWLREACDSTLENRKPCFKKARVAYVGPWGGANRLSADKAEAQPEPKDQFEGVKYVVYRDGSDGSAGIRRLRTRAEWAEQSPSSAAMLTPDLGPYAFVERLNGVIFACMQYEVIPWRPEVGEKVRLEDEPEEVGTVRTLPAPEVRVTKYYSVQWARYGPCDESLSNLRPFSFGPEEPEKKPEFEDGVVVVNGIGNLRVPLGCNQYADLSGARTNIRTNEAGIRKASDLDIEKYAKRGCPAVVIALRAHARQIAKGQK